MDTFLTAAAVCLNVTFCNDSFPIVAVADGVIGVNFEPIIPESTSEIEKG